MVFLAEDPQVNVNDSFLEDAKKGHAEYWGFPQVYARHKAVFDGFFEERLSRIRAATPVSTLLDIGCGYGLFQKYCQERGIATLGMDLSEEGVASTRRMGLFALRGDCNRIWFRKSFDAIVMCDILEHAQDPVRLLMNCRSWLRPGGAIYVQVPNVLGDVLPAKIFNLPYHLWQFSPETLRRLLEKCGYEVKGYWTGVMSVIGEYEKAGGPSAEIRAMWETARRERRGNRLQMLAISPSRPS